jgi:CubicO group peptidase (beta-lactamase class C family)
MKSCWPVIAAVFVLMTTRAAAQDPSSTGASTRSMAVFVDEFIPSEMERRHIPGAVFVLVSAGQLTIARGFGVADLASRRPVDPHSTIFGVGSVSKIVTATAALQLVEQGRLDLTRDVNAYLRSVQVVSPPATPVTLHHLLTHSAAFNEKLTGIGCRDPSEREPLDSYLGRSMPTRFDDPGQAISYSNHGMALAGLLVQDVSGQPFEEYVRDAILEPLEMRRSGFHLAGDETADFATGYNHIEGRHRPRPRDCVHTSPSGNFATTGNDMAQFLTAHLQGGANAGARILGEKTIRLMHARQFAPHSGISGWAYGFWEDRRGPIRGLMHDGGGMGFKALVYLLPDEHVGFFLAYNMSDQHPDGDLLEIFRSRFLETFFPVVSPSADQRGLVETAGTRFAGEYHYLRRARTTIERVVSLVNSRVRIDQADSGALTMTGVAETPVSLIPIAPMLFRRSDGRGLVAFDTIEANTPQHLTLDGGGVRTFDRVSYTATVHFQIAWLLSMTLAFTYAGLVRPAFLFVRARRRRVTGSALQRESCDRGESRARRLSASLTGIASGLNLVFLVAFPVAFFGRMADGIPDFVYGVPRAASILLLIPPTTAAIAVAASVTLFFVWREQQARLPFCIAQSLVGAALLSFIAFTVYWRLMGFQL